MTEPSESASATRPPDAIASDIDSARLAEALTLTDRRLRRLLNALNEGQDRDSQQFRTEMRRAKRQIRANRELREGASGG
jgi:hypothetical protein